MQSFLTRTALLAGAVVLSSATALAQNGACYLPNSTCTQTTAAACATAGGVFGGVGVPCPPYQVNGAGATLFADAATNAALTNDWINADFDFGIDFVSGLTIPLRDEFNIGAGLQADQLAPTNPASAAPQQVWWIHQYRSVGSVEGFTEFLRFQVCGDIPENLPSERGSLNSLLFASGNAPNGAAAAAGWGTPPGSACTLDLDPALADGPNASNTPVCIQTVDYANLDVPAVWAVRVSPFVDDCEWDVAPGVTNYGQNTRVSWGKTGLLIPETVGDPTPIPYSQTGESNLLPSLTGGCPFGTTLNTNLATPDNNTIYDTNIAWSPVAIIANRGTALDRDCNGVNDGGITYSQLQHGFVTGRLPNGENLVFATRDVGSGTRNAAMNSLGIDPSRGIGDHVGIRINSPPFPAGFADFMARLGPGHQPNNCAGSGVMEIAVENNRLAVGYTGVFGSSRAVGDARAGRYELAAVRKDVLGGTQYVQITRDSIYLNDNIDTGYQVGGVQTLVTRGNPRAHDFGAFAPAIETGPLMTNVEAAKFVRNIEESFGVPTPPNFMPGEFLTVNNAVLASVNAIVDPTAPLIAIPAPTDAAIQAYALANTTLRPGGSLEPVQWGDVDSGGTVRPAGLAGNRRPPLGATYGDGGTSGFRYYNGAAFVTVNGGQALSRRNQVQGDLNGDGRRDINDIEKLVEAYWRLDDAAGNPAAIDAFLQNFEPIVSNNAADNGSMAVNRLVVHVVADFDGDGEITLTDVKYFADGLATRKFNDPNPALRCKLDRKAGFTRADNAWFALKGNLALFGIQPYSTGAPYKAGDARADIAGNPVCPGAAPSGCDMIIDARDINYVCRNFVSDWANTDLACGKDLSADINGDCVVNYEDVREIVEVILETEIGDVDLDGDRDAADCAIATANLGLAGGWAQGDVNCDGFVTQADLDIICATGCPGANGDANCDGTVDFFDIDPFLMALFDPTTYAATFCGGNNCAADVNDDGGVDFFDIDAFLTCLFSGC